MNKKRKFTKILLCLALLTLALALCACEQTSTNTTTRQKYTVHFDVNTEYATNAVLDQSVKENMHAKQPSVETTDESMQDYVVFGWYTEKECVNEWNFRRHIITSDITLYAKWGYQYTVNYYIVDDLTDTDEELTPYVTTTIREGERVKEYPEYVVGFEYYGSYTDMECTQKFDYSTAINSSTNIYMKKSTGIALYDGNASGNLYDNLEAVAAGSNYAEGILAKAGWVEKKTMGENTYTYANFGYSPYNPDPYIELSLPLDIRHSQILTFTFKNLGKSSLFSVYFTTYIDEKQTEYSATGRYYSATFCKQLVLGTSQRNMSETDDNWIVATFDMSEILANGYSVWGTSTYLAAMRIQSTYNSVSTDDYSNAYLIKSITGTTADVTVEDSAAIACLLDNSDTDELSEKSALQESVNGFVFPKDYMSVTEITNGEVYNRINGLVLYTDNEIALRNTSYQNTSLTLTYTGADLDLSENCTFNIRLKNNGYQDEIKVYIYNNENVSVSTSLNIESRMQDFQNYFVNLSAYRFMKNKLNKVVIEYVSLGVDNALEIESVYFSEYRANDIAGINFNDKNAFGFSSSDDVGVTYDSQLKATQFDVKKSNATLLVQKNYSFTNDGYATATLEYFLEKSGITAITIGYFIDATYQYSTYPIDNTSLSRKAQKVSLPLQKDGRGSITGLSLTFRGVGSISIKAIHFDFVLNSAANFANNYTSFYNAYDWDANCKYVYDSSAEASKIIADTDKTAGFRTYYGYVAKEVGSDSWQPATNISLTGKTTIKIIYQNQSAASDLIFKVGLDTTEYGTGENAELQYQFAAVKVKTNMDNYEWSVVTFDLSQLFAGIETDDEMEYFLAKTELMFSGTILIRGIVVE